MRKKNQILLIVTFLMAAFAANAQNWEQIFKECASDRAANDNFGFSVAIDGDYAIVGAYQEDEDTLGEATLNNAGSAYIYKNEAGTWVQMQKIVASDRSSVDNFGYSVAISGDYVIVGAYQEDNDAVGANTMSNSGSAYIFKNIAGEWTEMQKIVASDRNTDDYFGASVGISGAYVIVGAYQEDENASGDQTFSNSGSAYIFHNVSDTWTQTQKIVASDRGAVDYFAYSVSISGDYAIAGAYSEDENASGGATLSNPGSAYIFKNNSGTWSQMQKIVASDRGAEDFFGYSVAISGANVIVGAYQEDQNATGGATLSNSGSAYIFKNNAGTWAQSQKIIASDRGLGDQFGFNVSISGDYAIVGASLEDEDANGANNLFNAGSAYIYKGTAGSWVQEQKVVASDRAGSDLFGSAVAISNSCFIVGAYQEDHDVVGGGNLSNPGSAYIFRKGVDINVKQNTTNIADAGSFSFGEVPFGENSGVITFTIENIGGSNLILSGSPQIAVSGTNAADFIIDQTLVVSPVLPFSSTTFTITFTPLASGSRSAVISIANNDVDENPYNFTVLGTYLPNADVKSLSSLNISIYPNPTSGIVNFDFSDNTIQQIKISDLAGKTIFNKSNPQQKESIDLSGFATGVYFINVQTDDQTFSVKMMKQ